MLKRGWVLWVLVLVAWTLVGLSFTLNYYFFAGHYVAIFKHQPTLGGMILQHGPVKVIARADFGGALIYSDAGVTIPRPGNQAGRVGQYLSAAAQEIRPLEFSERAIGN